MVSTWFQCFLYSSSSRPHFKPAVTTELFQADQCCRSPWSESMSESVSHLREEQGLNPFPPLPCFGKGGGTVDRFVVYYPHSSIEPYLPNVFSSAVCPVPAVPRFSGFSVTQAVSDAICLHPPLKGTSQWHTIPNSGCFPALTHTQPYPR